MDLSQGDKAEDRALVVCGDCLEILPGLPENSVDAVICDPPYDLTAMSRGGSPRMPGTGPFGRHRVDTKSKGGFMGKAWDATGVAFRKEIWEAVLKTLKPGGHALIFGGTRTYHRMVCAVEDAGFEIRDCLIWLTGQGFPKSLDIALQYEKRLCKYVDKKWLYRDTGEEMRTRPPFRDPDANEWAGYGTTLKPAYEPIILVRKPLSESTVAANVLKWGTGAINIDQCRIEGPKGSGVWGSSNKTCQEGRIFNQSPDGEGYRSLSHPEGRWPANVILECICEDEEEAVIPSGTGIRRNNRVSEGKGSTYFQTKDHGHEIGGMERITVHTDSDCPAAMLDRQSGDLTRWFNTSRKENGKTKRELFGDHSGDGKAPFYDSGGASRFFYVAKASSFERHFGLDDPGLQFSHGTTLRKVINTETRGNHHPTVKPLSLMRWLVRLVTPPDGLVLDPFGGSGTTAMAAVQEGFGCLLIEKEPEYCRIARARVNAIVVIGSRDLSSISRVATDERQLKLL